ncbi:Putative membrane protein YfjD, partial [hydrothermal vent metagenome]
DLNKEYNLNLPTDGPKTLNGLIQEELETLPSLGTCIKIGDYILEVVKTSNNAVQSVKLTATKPQEKSAQDHA